MSGEAPTADEVRLHRSSRLRKATPVFDPTDDTRPNRMVATRQPASTPSSQPPPNLSQKEVAVSSQSSTGPPKTGKGSRSALPGDWDLFTDPHTGDTRRLVAVAWVHRSSAQEASRFGEVLMGDGVQCTNAQRRPLYDILTVGPNGKNNFVLEVLLLNLKMSLYSWMFWDALPSLMGTEFCQRVRLILTDGDMRNFVCARSTVLSNPSTSSASPYLATSLQVQFARWAGPAFSDVPHLGQTTTSPVEGNHAVYKRPAAAGGAGVSSKTAPEVMLSRMDQLHSARAEKLNSVRDQSLQLPCRILDDSSIAVTKHRMYRKIVIRTRMDCESDFSRPNWFPSAMRMQMGFTVSPSPVAYIGAWMESSQFNALQPAVGAIGSAVEHEDFSSHIDDDDDIPVTNLSTDDIRSHSDSESLFRVFQEIQSESRKSSERTARALQLLRSVLGELSVMPVVPCRRTEGRLKPIQESSYDISGSFSSAAISRS